MVYGCSSSKDVEVSELPHERSAIHDVTDIASYPMLFFPVCRFHERYRDVGCPVPREPVRSERQFMALKLSNHSSSKQPVVGNLS